MTDISSNFARVFFDTSSIRNMCEKCGVTFFNTEEHWAFDDGELDELLALEKNEPLKYKSTCFSVKATVVNGKSLTDHCGCAVAFEQFIKNDARRIAEYLRLCFDDDLKQAQARSDILTPPTGENDQ